MDASMEAGGSMSNTISGGVYIDLRDSPHATMTMGSIIRPGETPKTQKGLVREEWSLLEEEYEDKAWLTPLPWMPECQFDPEDFYVPLNLDDQGRDGLRPRSRKAELENLFDSHVQGGAGLPKRVLLRGDAGFGKTTLCTKVAFDWKWGKTCIRALPHSTSLIVYYKLRLFDSKNSLENELFNFLYKRHSVQGKTVQVTMETLKALGRDLVLFLDGHDEMDGEGKQKLEALIKSCKGRECDTFSSARFLVTTRPNNQQDFLRLFEKHYTVGTLSIKRKELLVRKYFRNSSSKSEEFFSRYSNLELDKASPLTLFLLCWVSEHNIRDPLSNGRDLIFRCIVLLARRCNDRDHLELSDKVLKKYLLQLGQLFYVSKHYFITEDHLERLFNNPQLVFLTKNMGILREEISVGNVPVYTIAHKTFSESLSQHFRVRVSGMRSECLNDLEYEAFCCDVLSDMQFRNILEEISFEVYFPEKEDPVITVKYEPYIELSTRNGKPEIGLPNIKNPCPQTPSITIDCWTGQLNLASERIQSYIINMKWLTGNDRLSKHLMRMFPSSKYQIKFENILDDRFQDLVERLADFFSNRQESSRSRFRVQDAKQERELLVSLTKSLDVLEGSTEVENRSAEELLKGICTWARNQVTRTEIQRSLRKKRDGTQTQVYYDLSFLGPQEVKREDWELLEKEYEEDNWRHPFTWDPKYYLDEEDFHVPLNLDYSLWDGGERPSAEAELESLFDCPVQGRAKRVLLMGDDEFAMTMLCKKLAFDWSHKKTIVRALPADSVVIVLCDLKKMWELKNEIIEFVYERHSLGGKDDEATENALMALGSDLVLILDGYIDLTDISDLYNFLRFDIERLTGIFSHACILVTAKPTNDKTFLDLFEKRYSIGERPREKTKQLLLKYFRNNKEQSEEFCRLHLNEELDEVSPLTLSLLCWASQQKEQGQFDYGGGLLLQALALLARHFSDRLGLQLTDEEILKCLFRFGLLFCTWGYNIMPENAPLRFLKDLRIIQLAEHMGILKFHKLKNEQMGNDSVYREFCEYLSCFVLHVALEMRSKCFQDEYERIIIDLFASYLHKEQELDMVGREPVLTFESMLFKITSIIFEIRLEGLIVPNLTRMPSITHDSLRKCFSNNEPFKHFNDPGAYSQENRETTWAERIVSPFVKRECPEERKAFLSHLVKGSCPEHFSVHFNDHLNSRFVRMLNMVVDCFRKEQKAYKIEFLFPLGVNDERLFLTTLSKALGVFEIIPHLPAEELRERIASWAKNEPSKTYFDGDWEKGTLTNCCLVRFAGCTENRCTFIFGR